MDNLSDFTNFFVSEAIDIADCGNGTQSVIVHERDYYGFLNWHTSFKINLPQYEAEKD